MGSCLSQLRCELMRRLCILMAFLLLQSVTRGQDGSAPAEAQVEPYSPRVQRIIDQWEASHGHGFSASGHADSRAESWSTKEIVNTSILGLIAVSTFWMACCLTRIAFRARPEGDAL